MNPSLMPAGPDAQHMLAPSSMSVVIVIVIVHVGENGFVEKIVKIARHHVQLKSSELRLLLVKHSRVCPCWLRCACASLETDSP